MSNILAHKLPLVSIIMPVYNCEEYIEESILSLLAQTYTNIEILVVDSQSYDRSRDLVKQINDQRVRLIELETNLGLNVAFNEGLKRAGGDFIIRHDPDDLSSPSRIEKQVRFLRTHPELGMVSCLIKCITSVVAYRRQCIFIEKIQNGCVTRREIEQSISNNFIPIIFPTIMFRRNLFKEVNWSRDQLDFDDQIEMLLEFLKVSSIEKVPEVLYSYRRYPDSYHLIHQGEYDEYVQAALQASNIAQFLDYRETFNQVNAVERPVYQNGTSNTRVLMLIDALNIGGTETHVLSLAKYLSEQGIYVIVATNGGPLETMFEKYNILVYHVPMNEDYISNDKKFGLIHKVKGIIDKENINLLHCHLFASMQIGYEIYKKYRIPYVVTIHGIFYPNEVLFYTCRHAARIICVSEPIKKLLLQKFGGQIHGNLVVIPNGVEFTEVSPGKAKQIRQELNIEPDDLLVVYCSRLAWNKAKAAEHFAFSCLQLSFLYPNLKAIILGDGSERPIVEREVNLINEALNKEMIQLVGARFNVLDYYAASDVVIGTARVALEAMSCGKPVISLGNQGYVGLIDDQTQDKQWKMYFGDHDSDTKSNSSLLSNSIRELLDDPVKRDCVGRWSQQWCRDHFDINVVAKQIGELYGAVIKESGFFTEKS